MTRRKPTQLLLDYSLHIAIILLAAACAVYKPLFIRNMPPDLIKRTAAFALLGLAMGCVMRVGEIDLSLGMLMGMGSLVSALLASHSRYSDMQKLIPNPILQFIAACLAALIICTLIGLLNGWIVTRLKIPSFVSTFAMATILYGLWMLIATIPTFDYYRRSGMTYTIPEFRYFITHTTKIGNWAIPNYVWYAIALSLVLWLLWRFTRLGKNMRAAGDNPVAAENAGVNVNRTVILSFVIAGLLCGISGIIATGRVSGPVPSAGTSREIEAIIFCLLGGVSLRGGRGSVLGIIIGVAFFQLLGICLQWLYVPDNYIYIINGSVVLIAAALSVHRELRARRISDLDDTAPIEIIEEN